MNGSSAAGPGKGDPVAHSSFPDHKKDSITAIASCSGALVLSTETCPVSLPAQETRDVNRPIASWLATAEFSK